MNPPSSSICIFGAGSIGCYVGGRLAATGATVSLIGRERIGSVVQQHGLTLSDLDGAQLHAAPASFQFSTETSPAGKADLVLVCVKSAATTEAAEQLAPVIQPGAILISLQNGLGNADVLRAGLPQHTVLDGIVEFNVLNRGEGRFHQGSEGSLECQSHPGLEPLLPLFEAAGLPLALHQDMLPVQWAKLLLNLNNPINALSGIPLKEELAQRDFRRCIALAQSEALGLLNKAGITPARLTPLPAHWIPRLLDVPDWLFRLLGNKMLAIDPVARSSMWEDLEAGRKTEVDWLNGEVMRLAQQQQRQAPVNTRLLQLIRQAEDGGKRDWSGTALLKELRQAAMRS